MGELFGIGGLRDRLDQADVASPQSAAPDPASDPSAELVNALLKQLDFGSTDPPEKASRGKRLSAKIGDALRTFSAIRTGRPIPPSLIGEIDDREEREEARHAAKEAQMRDVKNMIRVRNFERESAARLAQRTGAGTTIKDAKRVITQEHADKYGLSGDLVGKHAWVRDRVDKSTGMTTGMEYLGPVTENQNKDTFKEFETIITKDMVEKFGIPEGFVGEFMRVRDTISGQGDGQHTKREILGPGVESSSQIVTEQGVFTKSSKLGTISGPLLHPATKEPLRPVQLVMAENALRVAEMTQSRAGKMSDSVVKHLTEQGVAVDAAETGLRFYIDVGSPDLGLIFDQTPDRLKSPDSIRARANMAAALVPIRKFFSGAAVTESEAKFGEALIAKIDGPVAPGVLKESFLALINHSRRTRRRILMDARSNGDDISGFEHELSDGSLDFVDSLDEFALGGRGNPTFLNRVIVDENGNLMIEGE